MTPRARSRGYLLIETLILVAFLVGGMVVVARFVVDGLYLQRIAAQRLDRMAVVDGLLLSLRNDAGAAESYAWDATARTLVLRTSSQSADATDVIYHFTADAVARLEGAAQTSAWRSLRLSFAAQVEPGARRDVLRITCSETPPERATQLRVRSFDIVVLLPPTPPNTRTAPQEGAE